MPGPDTESAGPGHRARHRERRGLCRAPALGPGALCVGAGALCVGCRHRRRAGALCAGPRALSVSALPSALCVEICVGPPLRALCVGALWVCPRSSDPATLLALTVCVGPCWASGPAAQIRVFIAGHLRSVRAPIPVPPICRPPAPIRVPPRPVRATPDLARVSAPVPVRVPLIRPRRPPAPTRVHPALRATLICSAGPQLRSTCYPARGPSSDPRATHPARRVPFFQERTPNLTVWGKSHM